MGTSLPARVTQVDVHVRGVGVYLMLGRVPGCQAAHAPSGDTVKIVSDKLVATPGEGV